VPPSIREKREIECLRNLSSSNVALSRLLARSLSLSSFNRVTVKLITASFEKRLLRETRDNHETVDEQAAPGRERNTFEAT